jgi:hypothetical protein
MPQSEDSIKLYKISNLYYVVDNNVTIGRAKVIISMDQEITVSGFENMTISSHKFGNFNCIIVHKLGGIAALGYFHEKYDIRTINDNIYLFGDKIRQLFLVEYKEICSAFLRDVDDYKIPIIYLPSIKINFAKYQFNDHLRNIIVTDLGDDTYRIEFTQALHD